jgi:hypothetical protein
MLYKIKSENVTVFICVWVHNMVRASVLVLFGNFGALLLPHERLSVAERLVV